MTNHSTISQRPRAFYDDDNSPQHQPAFHKYLASSEFNVSASTALSPASSSSSSASPTFILPSVLCCRLRRSLSSLRLGLLLLIGCGSLRTRLVTCSDSESLVPELVSSQPQQQQQQQHQHANSLVQSVWETIRASLEAAAMTRTNSGHHHATTATTPAQQQHALDEVVVEHHHHHNTAKYPRTVTPRTDQLSHQVTSRRRALLEQSLRLHYANYLQKPTHSQPQQRLDTSYFSKPQPKSITTTTTPTSSSSSSSSSSHTATTQEHHHHHDNNNNSHDDSSSWPLDGGCIAYNEHQTSYWTYIWCPQQFLQQVHIPVTAAAATAATATASVTAVVEPGIATTPDTDAMIHTFEAQGGLTHELGTWQPHEDPTSTSTTTTTTDHKELPWHFAWTQYYLQHLATAMSVTMQRWQIEEYGNGDWCQSLTADAVRRETLVIMYPPEETPCGSNNNNINKRTRPARIAGVHEPQPCRYVLHACAAVNNEEEEKRQVEKGDDADIVKKEQVANSVSVPNDEATDKMEHDVVDDDATRQNRNVKSFFNYLLHQSTQDKLAKAQPDRTTSLDVALPPFHESMRRANRQLLQDMFRHGYDAYMYNAYPAPELRPITCKPGTFNLVKLKALTLIDALDTLVVLGNYTEFARSVERLRQLDASMREPQTMTREDADDEDDVTTVTRGGLFAVDQNVSVFETNIRVLGGLLSAHQLAEAYLKNCVLESDVWDWQGDVMWGGSSKGREDSKTKQTDSCLESLVDEECSSTLQRVIPISGERLLMKENLRQCRNATTQPKSFWVYDGFLLRLATDIGTRLLPAFDSKTGIPYGTVNLLYGVPKGETPIASLAGGGTLTLEMELLSRLTGDEAFGRAAKLAARALWMRRSSLNLFGKHINIHNGDWTETLSGIGSNSDSFYEYLVKHYIVFPEDADFWTMMISSYTGVHNSTRLGEWYADVDMNLGTRSGGARRVFESLMAFYPGMQVLLGELPPAARTLNSFFMVREFLGFLPERFNYANWRVDGGLRGAGRHPLRPEILESCYFMHQATKSNIGRQSYNMTKDEEHPARSTSGWLWAADFAVHALESVAKVECGFASVKEVSFTASGAISFDGLSHSDVRLSNEMPSFFLSETLKYLYLTFDDENVIHTDDQRQWIFTTEAHPIHHEPIRTGRLSRELENMKQGLKQMLKSRLETEEVHSSRKVYEKSSIVNEKWTDNTKLKAFRSSYELALNELRHRGKEHRRWIAGKSGEPQNSLIEPIVPPCDVAWGNDHFAERDRNENWAHLSFNGMGVGEGSILKKACYNIYNPEFLWLRALHGGVLDYADVYISIAADDPGKDFQPANRYMLLGSADALGYQGSSVYIGLPELQRQTEKSCPLSLKNPLGAKLGGVEQEQGPPEGAVRYDMGPNVGSFDVSVFADGGGFYVQHVETKERVVATVIVEEQSKDAFVMAYTSMPPEGRDHPKLSAEASNVSSRWTSWKNMFRRDGNRQGSSAEKVQLPERSVVLSDMQGNAFVCDIQVLLRSAVTETEPEISERIDLDDEEVSNDDSPTTKDEVLAHFPCAPGFFGAAHHSHLVATEGLIIEEVIRAPDVGNEYGCNGGITEGDIVDGEQTPLTDVFDAMMMEDPLRESVDHNLETCTNSVIQIVRRGTCTFETKAMTQKQLNNASAVIVVNDIDEELFVMSRGQDTIDKPTIPVTVLVTGADGEGILSLIADHAKAVDRDDYLVARISLVRQGRIGNDQQGQFIVNWSSETPVWPILRASPEAIQIFSRGGWGVHAVRNGELQGAWQLFLLQHQLHTRPDQKTD